MKNLIPFVFCIITACTSSNPPNPYPNVSLPHAKSYEIAKKENLSHLGRTRGDFYIISKDAKSIDEMAQTAMKAALDLEAKTRGEVTWVVLENSIDSIGKGDNLALVEYSPDGKGGSGEKKNQFMKVEVVQKPRGKLKGFSDFVSKKLYVVPLGK
jgi:hypothetical protein